MDNMTSFHQTFWNKNTMPVGAQAVGMWYSLFAGAGNPPAASILGTGDNLEFQPLSGATPGAISAGSTAGGRGRGFKYVTEAMAVVAGANTTPNVLMLVDLLGFYPVTTVTATTAQALGNTVPIPRHSSGEGVQAIIVPSTIMGAATPDITLGYTNSQGTPEKATPATLPKGLTAAPVGSVVYSGNGAGKYGPFVPLAAGDTGVQSVDSITLSASYVSGVLNIILCKPILTVPIATAGVASVTNFINTGAGMPRVYDGACLAWLMLAGAATPVNTSISGYLNFAWY